MKKARPDNPYQFLWENNDFDNFNRFVDYLLNLDVPYQQTSFSYEGIEETCILSYEQKEIKIGSIIEITRRNPNQFRIL